MPRQILIHAGEPEFQLRYADFVRSVFRSADFVPWIAGGHWDERYRALVLEDAGRIVASVGITRMALVLDGSTLQAWQWGAVATVPSMRGRGLSRQLLEAAIECSDAAPMLLFANPGVRDFYPRFGFRPATQWRYHGRCVLQPAAPAPRRDPQSASDRQALIAAMANAWPSSRRFGARDYGALLAWYATQGWSGRWHALDAERWVLTEQSDRQLRILDVIASQPFDLREALPSLIDTPIEQVTFEFTPDDWWSGALSRECDDEAHLYVRGFDPTEPRRYPLLART